MTTDVTRPNPGRRAVDLTMSILLMIAGLIVLVLEAIVDVLLALTSADSPGNVDGAVSTAFMLLLVGGIVWLVATAVVIVFLVRRRAAWWIALIGAVVPLACGVGGFLAVTSVVQ
jgi:hypothetical protein